MTAPKKQPPCSPCAQWKATKEKLLVLLAELKKHKGMERAEQFAWFTENSSSGENCQYAKKAMDSFYTQRHYEEISSLLRDIISVIEEIDDVRQQHQQKGARHTNTVK